MLSRRSRNISTGPSHTHTHTYRQHQSNSRRSLLVCRSLSVILCPGTVTERLWRWRLSSLARWLAAVLIYDKHARAHRVHLTAVSSAVHAADRCSSASLSVYTCLSVCQALQFRGVAPPGGSATRYAVRVDPPVSQSRVNDCRWDDCTTCCGCCTGPCWWLQHTGRFMIVLLLYRLLIGAI